MNMIDLVLNAILDDYSFNKEKLDIALEEVTVDELNKRCAEKKISIYKFSSVEKFQLLKESGFDIKIADEYFLPLIENKKPTIDLLIKNGYNIHYQNGNEDNALFYVNTSTSAKRLIESGVSLDVRNKHEETALFVNGSADVIKVLLDNGIDVNAVDIYGNNAMKSCYTPKKLDLLLKAGISHDLSAEDIFSFLEVAKYSEQFMEVFIDNNVNIAVIRENEKYASPLFSSNNTLLKAYGSHFKEIVNAENVEGETALFYVKDIDFLNELIKLGADLSHEDKEGKTFIFNLNEKFLKKNINLFKEKNINLNHKDNKGRNILSDMRDEDLISILIKENLDYDNIRKKYRNNPELTLLMDQKDAEKQAKELSKILKNEEHIAPKKLRL